MKCGNCKSSHATVADVKACYGGAVTVAQPTTEERLAALSAGPRPNLSVFATQQASDAQVRFIRSLAEERECHLASSDTRATIADVVAGRNVSKREASNTITELKTLPFTPKGEPTVEQGTAPDVPEGRYAVRGEDGVVKFYRVDRPTEGKWAGRTFVKVQASDDLHPIRNREAREAILASILEAGIEDSLRLYGTELGRCGVCGRTLTDETSRAYGIGPICRDKF